jgi:threonine dehydrogenase-like Zn-dependent dehydrogenase
VSGAQMRGVVLPGRRRVEFHDHDVPAPGPGQALLRMRASGLCGSDLRVIYRPEVQGHGPEAYRGVIAGHEPCGVVEAVGPGVRDWRPGDRAAVYHIAGCGECEDCRGGWMVSCTSPRRAAYGWQRDGGHAEFMLADVRTLLPLPEPLTFLDGALVACGFGTAYAACLRAGIRAGESVLVAGLGPVGLGVAELARAMGAEVVGVELDEARVDVARARGIACVAAGAGALDVVRDSTGGRGVDVAVDCASAQESRLLTLAATRRWGRTVWVGEGGTVSFEPSPLLIHEQRTLHGSWVCSVPQMAELLDRLVTWDLHPENTVTHTFPLEQAAEAYATFDAGGTGKVALTWD